MRDCQRPRSDVANELSRDLAATSPRSSGPRPLDGLHRMHKGGQRFGDGLVAVGDGVLVDQGGLGEEWPILAMSSLVVAPVAAASVAARWRRS